MNKKLNLLQFYKLRAAYDRLSQITWTIRNANERFSLNDSKDQEQLTKVYVAMILDVENIYQEMVKIKEKYAK